MTKTKIQNQLIADRHTIYNEYTEHQMSGQEIREYFKGCYERLGSHNTQITSMQIYFDTRIKKLSNNHIYRVLINKYFCKIFENNIDNQPCFFRHTRVKPAWVKD